MWYLESYSSEEEEVTKKLQKFFLPFKKESKINFGRKGCDFTIEDDKSISRQHAEVFCNAQGTQLICRDLKSKYGTFINAKKVEENPVTLQQGDILHLGVFQSKFIVRYLPLHICTSRVSATEKAQADELLRKITDDYSWEQQLTNLTTHLLVSSHEALVPTEKVALALLQAKPIVTFQYILDLCLRFSKTDFKELIPSIETYIPNITNTDLGNTIHGLSDYKISIACDAKRATIFENKTIVCVSEQQFKKHKQMIEFGSGTIVDASNEEIDDQFLESHRMHIVLKDTTKNSTKNSNLEALGFDLIPESAIAATIFSMDVNHFLNPKFPEEKQKPLSDSEEDTDVEMTEEELKEHIQSQMKPTVSSQKEREMHSPAKEISSPQTSSLPAKVETKQNEEKNVQEQEETNVIIKPRNTAVKRKRNFVLASQSQADLEDFNQDIQEPERKEQKVEVKKEEVKPEVKIEEEISYRRRPKEDQLQNTLIEIDFMDIPSIVEQHYTPPSKSNSTTFNAKRFRKSNVNNSQHSPISNGTSTHEAVVISVEFEDSLQPNDSSSKIFISDSSESSEKVKKVATSTRIIENEEEEELTNTVSYNKRGRKK